MDIINNKTLIDHILSLWYHENAIAPKDNEVYNPMLRIVD